MKLSQFQFDLPKEKIATEPTRWRDECKLLVLHKKTGEIEHRQFKDIIDYFGKHDRFVLNDTKVFPARLYGKKEKIGAEVHVAGPSTLMPVELDRMGAVTHRSIEEAVTGADAIMGLRIQLERQKKGLFPSEREYAHFFGLDDDKLALAKDGAIVLHPGPVNRGLDIMTPIVDSDVSVINEQVLNGVSVRMALLFLLTRRKKNDETV